MNNTMWDIVKNHGSLRYFEMLMNRVCTTLSVLFVSYVFFFPELLGFQSTKRLAANDKI